MSRLCLFRWRQFSQTFRRDVLGVGIKGNYDGRFFNGKELFSLFNIMGNIGTTFSREQIE